MNWHDQPFAPDDGAHLANINDIADGNVHEVILGSGQDAFRIILMRNNEQLKVYWNRCPHFGVPLNSTSNSLLILPERQVMCAIHCAIFRMDDGQCIDGPIKGQHLTKIEVKLDASGNIIVQKR